MRLRQSLVRSISKWIRFARKSLSKWIEPRAPDDLGWDVPIGMGLKGVAEIRSALGITEEMYLRAAGQLHADARAYLIYTAIDEVQKACVYLMRLKEYTADTTPPGARDLVERTILTQAHEDSAARRRRLLESLVTLVCFTQTNDQEYYRCLLLLEELDELLSARSDRETFYDTPNANVDDSVRGQADWLKQVLQKLDRSKLWYCSDGLNWGEPHKWKPGRFLSSHRKRLQYALPLMTSGERLVVGFSYVGYSDASDGVHYTASRRDVFLPLTDERLGATAIGILCFHILVRCRELLGNPTMPTVAKVANALANSNADEMAARLALKHASIGDFVVAAGCLGEVVEVKESRFKLVSYRVAYLAERPKPQLTDEWYPTSQVQVLYSRTLFDTGIAGMGEKGLLPPDIVSRVRGLSEAEYRVVMRKTVLDLWNAGLRELFHGRQ